jgi:MFS family permease
MRDALIPLRHAAFRWLVTGRVINMLGSAVAPIALAFAVLDLTGKASDLGLVLGLRSFAMVVFLLFGGVLADRLPRYQVMVVSAVLSGLTQAVIATLILTGSATITLIAGIGLFQGTVQAFTFPAAAALMGQTVPDGVRQQANALSRLGINAAQIGGAAVGAALVAATSPGWGLAADAATFFIASACFAAIRVPNVSAPAGAKASTLHELRVGWREFAGREWVWVVVLAFMFINAATSAAQSVLGPVIAKQTIGVQGWGLVMSAGAVGLVLGGVIALRWKPRRYLLVGCVLSGGLLLLPLGLAAAPHLAILMGAAFLGFAAVEQFGVAWDTTLQDEIPADRLARVYAYDALGSLLAQPIGLIAIGPIAAVAGTESALFGCVGVIAACVVGMMVSRDVRTLRRRSVSVSVAEPAVAPA